MNAYLPTGAAFVRAQKSKCTKGKNMTKSTIFAAALLAASSIFAGASAGEFADSCKERLAADGRDTSGCDCLEEKILATPGLADEMTKLGAIEDPKERFAAASPEAQDAMKSCTRG